MANTNLVIVESPAKAKTIGKYLGPGFEVKASMGHIRDLPKSKLGVDVSTFEPDYENIKDKADVIRELRKSAKASDRIYLATDPDREGEAISWHLKELLNIPDDKTYRVTFNEITKKVVNQSIANPRDIDQDLVDAQQARRVLDRIVGYQLSPLLWKKIRRGLSAGAGGGHPAGGGAGGGDPGFYPPGVLVHHRGPVPGRPQSGRVPGGVLWPGKADGADQRGTGSGHRRYCEGFSLHSIRREAPG